MQDRRLTDVKAKFAKLLADVDLLILPRFTVSRCRHRPRDFARAHALDKDQVEAIRDYMKSGRPVMAALGFRFRAGRAELPKLRTALRNCSPNAASNSAKKRSFTIRR